MKATAIAPVTGTILNPLATGFGASFAIEEYSSVAIRLDETGQLSVNVADQENKSVKKLVRKCMEHVIEAFGDAEVGSATVAVDVPIGSGLGVPSSIVNATVLATADALDIPIVFDQEMSGEESMSLTKTEEIGRNVIQDTDSDVPATYSSLTASLYGGITVTDEIEMEIIHRDQTDWEVLVWLPPKRISPKADRDRCSHLEVIADQILELIQDRRYEDAMMLNGFAFSSALGLPSEPLVEALPITRGVTPAGLGPGYIAVGDQSALETVKQYWELREGSVWITGTSPDGARIP